MKIFGNLALGLLTLTMLGSLVSCEQKITIQSDVHPDGTISRTVIFTEVDSAKIEKNILGLRPGNGWDVQVEPFIGKKRDTTSKAKTEPKVTIVFHKRFPSIEAANEEFDTSVDTLFHVRAAFEKRFRWFYAYIRYSDTYGKLNRFHLSPAEFLTPEDVMFINRLPAEGEVISKADSLYLEQLSERVFENYFKRALYEEHFQAFVKATKSEDIEGNWVDSLYRKKEKMFLSLLKTSDGDFFDKLFMLSLVDSVFTSFPRQAVYNVYRDLHVDIEKRWHFILGTASEGKFTHVITLPGEIVNTNADSVSGNILYWRPMTLKFLLNDHTLYVETRRPNYWAFILSGIVILFTAFVFLRKGRVL